MADMDWRQRLRHNVARVRETIAAACARRGRDPGQVHLVGVTKYVSPVVLAELVAVGVTDIGESRPQQLVARAETFGGARLDWPEAPEPGAGGPRWHLIGHLQRNKVKALLQHARIIHSLDSARLARTLEERAAAQGCRVDALVEVNVAGEQSKGGVAPEDLAGLVAELADCPNVCLRGLMTMAPWTPAAEDARPHFVRLRELLGELQSSGAAGPACTHLSMGMSQDYAVAVEEGATFVRVGSALFEGLPSGDPRPH
jgi:pyridoxal phosphate enzyme (YggS family)